ncbi:MAG: copper resistance protein CopD, partial [Actinomycetia bacterium]|nr:copper resistance protein CopD [Actinomycetes bacterium]
MTTSTETTTSIPVRRSRITSVSLGLTAVALVAAAFGLVLAGGTYEALPGIADPGPLVTWGAPALRVLTDLAAIATVGLLLSATILAPSGKDGTLSRAGRQDAVRAVWAAGV